jgi:hypothetical protein
MDEQGDGPSGDEPARPDITPERPDPSMGRTSGIREPTSGGDAEPLTLASLRAPAPPPASSPPGQREAVRLAAWLLIAGGALAAIGSFLRWAFLTYPSTADASKTVAVGHPSVGIGFGTMLVVLGVSALSRPEPAGRRLRGWVLLFASGLLLVLVLAEFASGRTNAITRLVENTAKHLSLPVAQVQAAIDRQVATGLVRYRLGFGIYVTLAGAVIAVVGSVLMLRSGRR